MPYVIDSVRGFAGPAREMPARHSIESVCGLPERDSWASHQLPPPSIKSPRARASAHAAIRAKASRTARAMIKERARDYALRPRELDAFGDGLSRLSPRTIVWCLNRIRHQVPQARWFGYGGEVPAINLCGALLYARYSRAIASRNARRAG
jgi:hypothetical protein